MSNALSLTAIFISGFSLIMSLAAIIFVVAQKLSTHKIEFKPLLSDELREEDKFQEEAEEEDKLLQEALKLSQSKRKKKSEDPLDSILETSNF
jgi:hypothetical protein